RMHLVASSVTAAFYGNSAQVRERYAQIERGDIGLQYPRPPQEQKQTIPKKKRSLADRLKAGGEKVKARDAQKDTNKSRKRVERS
ncbi:MAG: hypothetical protein FWD84_00265, partial [Oscillospiraceae bacterium]|nr:hypothetical protein [Oscillospiraceae bacterium]